MFDATESTFRGRPGIGDIISRINIMLGAACAFGCDVRVPRPALLLSPKHNSGHPLGPGVSWGRYFDLENAHAAWSHVLEDLPEGASDVRRSFVWNRLPTVGELRAISGTNEQNETQKLQVISIGVQNNNHLRLTRPFIEQFWVPEVGMAAAMTELGGKGPRSASCQMSLAPLSSPKLLSSAQEAAAELFGSGPIMHVHLRRGDKLKFYPNDCATVPAVVWNLVHRARWFEVLRGLQVSQVFVLTDETNVQYRHDLHERLQVERTI